VLADSDLQSTETVLRPGDVVVQRGTSHRWENRSSQPARMAFILVDGAFTADLRATLGEVTLLHGHHEPRPGRKTVVITGAARGQGAAEAELLVRAGALVIGTDVLEAEGAVLQDHLGENFAGLFEYRQLDVSRHSTGPAWPKI